MKRLRGLITTTIAIVLAGCGSPIFDSVIDGPYKLLAADKMEQTNVCYDLGNGACIGRVSETVFAVGWDSAYIVAARHPDNDRSKVEFFYIDRAIDGRFVDPSVAVKGPFNAPAFERERQRLALPTLSRELASLK